jgi:PAS domain S-box-containing protein
VPNPYQVSSLPAHEVAELHRLMAEEIKEVAVFFLDTRGIITVWTRGAEEMKGFNAQDAIGSHLRMLYTPEDRERGRPEHNLGEAEKHGFYREETWRQRKDGTVFWARITLTALRDADGRLVGFSKITVDLTDHKMLERCIKERQETQRILRTANAGMWTWHPAMNEIEVSSNFLGLLGQPDADTTMPLDRWLEYVDEQDRSRVAAAFDQARNTSTQVPMVMDTRMCRQDGTCRWFHIHADWFRESEDKPFALSGVNVDIDNLKTAEDELRRAIQKLRDTDARKDEFLAMLAHELRNPLAPIRSAAELLKRVRLGDAQLQKTSDIIARQVEHMTSLVDDLLDVSRVTRGIANLEQTPMDVRVIVRDAVEQVDPLVRSRRHHLAVHLAPASASVLGDHKRLVQILANLLNNAAKYTPEGGHIELRTEVRNDEVSLIVSDNGIGMEPELAHRAFELFAQAERSPDRSSGGLGLGLALVKSLAELHGGRVACFSEGPGRGSRFTVTFPLVQPSSARPAAQAGDDTGEPGHRPLRILVVDDNADAGEMLGLFLEASGHQVAVEQGARPALQRAAAEPPDVCVLDIGLPEMDGNELARRLRAQPETSRALLVAVTGYGQEQDRRAALSSGFDHHLVKPVNPEKLLSLLKDARPA